MKTIYVNPKDVERKWWIIDAEGKRLGHVAVKAVELLRGKHKPEYVPFHELGDYVIIINAGKVEVSGNKAKDKLYYRHTGYPGGLKVENFNEKIAKKPTFPIEAAVRGMLPHTPMGRKLFRNLKVYEGAEHPHGAQKPQTMVIE
ncbi:MAG: 50S ribosomal protein L13 [Spirochaetales bacterium]|nr:50S ribosomal protein L13 [Spirochaetales bacterium]